MKTQKRKLKKNSKKKNARTPHALDIVKSISLLFDYVSLLPNRPTSCALVSGNTNKIIRPKEGRNEGVTD